MPRRASRGGGSRTGCRIKWTVGDKTAERYLASVFNNAPFKVNVNGTIYGLYKTGLEVRAFNLIDAQGNRYDGYREKGTVIIYRQHTFNEVARFCEQSLEPVFE